MSGAGYVATSALFYATYGVWSKLMVGAFGEFNQAGVKAAMLLAVLVPLGWWRGWFKPIRKSDWKWFGAIALAGGLNQAPYFFGFEHLTVGTATLLFYTALTVGAYGLGIVLFKERVTWSKGVAFGLALAGLSVIYRLHLQAEQFLPAVSTVAAGVMGAVGVVLTKKLSGSYSEVQIITGYLVAMIGINPGISVILGETLPPVTATGPWLAQVGYAASYLVANLAVVAGFKRLDASVGALIGLLEIIFAAVMGVVFFGESVTGQLIAGSGLILVAMTLPEVEALWGRKRDSGKRSHD